MICQASLRQKVVPLSDRVILETRSTPARPAAGKVFIQNERIRGCGMCGWYICYRYIYLIIRYMDIIWMSRLGLGSGDFGVTSCQINVSKLLLLWLHRPSVWVLLVELCQADLHDLVGHLWNHESTLSTRQVIWLTKTPWTFTFLIHSHQMSQPTSSVLTSFYLFQWLVVHVQSFSRLFLEVPLVVAPGGSWDNPFEEDQKGPSLTWANLQFFPPVGSSELENINDTFGASCQWIFGLLSLVESLHP